MSARILLLGRLALARLAPRGRQGWVKVGVAVVVGSSAPTGVLGATPNAPDPAEPVASTAIDARTRAAAERPFRWILQADQINRKPTPDTARRAPPPAAPATSNGPSPARSEPVARPTAQASPSPSPSPSAGATPGPAPVAAAPSGQPSPAAPAPVAAQATVTPVATAPETLPSPSHPTPPSRPSAPEPAAPRLLVLVEPELSEALSARLQEPGEVQAELELQPDGRVAQVRLLLARPPALAAPVLVALRQWRYDPGIAGRRVPVALQVKPAD